MTSLIWGSIQTPAGTVSVGCGDLGVARIRFGPPPGTAGDAGAEARDAGAQARDAWTETRDAGTDLRDGPVPGHLRSAVAQLAAYFSCERTAFAFDLPLDWGDCSGSRRAVLSLLAETVPFGQTITYGALAGRLARLDGRPPIGARAIGRIMGSNPIPLIVPCHRVVAADGLGGFSGGCGIELKRWLLAHEGALPAMLDFGPPAALCP